MNKIKVFSVESKDRKQKWQKVKNNFNAKFKKIKLDHKDKLVFGESKSSILSMHQPKLILNPSFIGQNELVNLKAKLSCSSQENQNSNLKRYKSVNQREVQQYNPENEESFINDTKINDY